MSLPACWWSFFWGARVLIAWGYWQIYGTGGWRDQLYASEGSVASRRALDDFRDGHLRLYTIGGENEKAKYHRDERRAI